jgi:hypothetical protein
MIINVYVLSITFSILFLLMIVALVRKNKLMEKYSLLWILFGVTVLVMSLTPLFIEKIAAVLDIKYAPSVLFLIGLIYLILYSLHLTVIVSSQAGKITRLNQELGILKEKMESKGQEGSK